MMKNSYLFSFIFLSFVIVNSCKSNRIIHKDVCENQFPILDSIAYVAFPNDNWMTNGNQVFKKIIANGAPIIPCLIETIKDTTETSIRVADSYNYKVGDVAILLLPYISKPSLNLRNLIFEEFKQELENKNMEEDFFQSIYYFIFFSNTDIVNYAHRKRFYKKVKENI
ncbi:MAG: hypothetical protein JKY08_07875 [Flavobacteriaceae bacterium]|nr:hypothetical protein [Flavobacteriaceae bacterium]